MQVQDRLEVIEAAPHGLVHLKKKQVCDQSVELNRKRKEHSDALAAATVKLKQFSSWKKVHSLVEAFETERAEPCLRDRDNPCLKYPAKLVKPVLRRQVSRDHVLEIERDVGLQQGDLRSIIENFFLNVIDKIFHYYSLEDIDEFKLTTFSYQSVANVPR